MSKSNFLRTGLREKYALRALSGKFSIAGLKEPDEDRTVPRYLYLLVMSISSPPKEKVMSLGILPVLLNITILLFFRLTLRFHFEQYWRVVYQGVSRHV